MLQRPTFRQEARQLRPLQLQSAFAVVAVSFPHPIFENDWDPLPCRIRPLEPCKLHLVLRIPAFVLLVLQGY